MVMRKKHKMLLQGQNVINKKNSNKK